MLAVQFPLHIRWIESRYTEAAMRLLRHIGLLTWTHLEQINRLFWQSSINYRTKKLAGHQETNKINKIWSNLILLDSIWSNFILFDATYGKGKNWYIANTNEAAVLLVRHGTMSCSRELTHLVRINRRFWQLSITFDKLTGPRTFRSKSLIKTNTLDPILSKSDLISSNLI